MSETPHVEATQERAELSEVAEPSERAEPVQPSEPSQQPERAGLHDGPVERADKTDRSVAAAAPSPASLTTAASEPPATSVEGLPTPVPTTSDPRVDDALSRLEEIDSLPLTEQVEVYADIHRRLAGVLSDPDSQA